LSRIWGFKGKPLQVKVQQGFKNFYIYSAVSVITGENFDYIMTGVDTGYMNAYIDAFSKSLGEKKILLYMDQAGWHKSKDLRIPTNITIRYLPPYSPELNPVERLWKRLKQETLHNRLYNTLTELEESVSNVLKIMTNADFFRLCKCSCLYHVI
jgi:transposase